MKNNDIHNDYDDKIIRDFLSQEYESNYKNCDQIGNIEYLQNQIDKLTRQLVYAKKSQAALELIHSRGWEIFDCSDEIIDYTSSNWFPFVGTIDEWQQFKKNLIED